MQSRLDLTTPFSILWNLNNYNSSVQQFHMIINRSVIRVLGIINNNKILNFLLLILRYMSTLKDIHHLPQISLSKLYDYIETKQKSNKSNSVSKSYTNSEDHILTSAHNDIIKVQSPFYERHQDQKGTCTCAYHRMKRYKEQPTLMKEQHNNKIKNAINEYKMRIAAAVKASNEYKKTLNGEFLNKNLKGLINFSTLNNQKTQNIREKQREKERDREIIDNYNYIFQQILKKRMAPFGNHQKVDHLIKFIKMKSIRQPTYLKKIRDYLYLHLMKVSKKISFNDLLNTTDDNKDLICKIAHILNCSQEVAREFVRAIQKASKELQNYLDQLTKQKQLQQDRKIQESRNTDKKNNNIKQFENAQNKENRGSIRHNSNCQNKKSEIQEKKKSEQINENNQLKQRVDFVKKYDNLLKIEFRKKSSVVSIINDLSSSRKKSKRQQILSFATQKQDSQKLKTTNSIGDNLKQIKSKREILKQESAIQKQKQKNRLSKMNQNAHLRKSKFSTTKTYKIAEIKEQEAQQKEYEKNQLQSNPRKKRKSKIVQKPNPFNSINYSFLLTNEQFQKVKCILNTQDNPSTDQQRMRRLFNYLLRKIQNNPQFLENFIKIFKQVLSQEQIALLRKKFADNLLRIMIQKLTKQLDDCIFQVQVSQKSPWEQQQVIEQAKRQKQNLMKKTLQFESVHQNQALIDQFNKFTIIENIPLPVSLIQLEPLEQIQLGQLVLQSLVHKKESKSRISISKSRKSRSTFKQEYRFDDSLVDEEKHRRILRYMKKRYPSAFNQVQTNIKDAVVNNSLIF